MVARRRATGRAGDDAGFGPRRARRARARWCAAAVPSSTWTCCAPVAVGPGTACFINPSTCSLVAQNGGINRTARPARLEGGARVPRGARHGRRGPPAELPRPLSHRERMGRGGEGAVAGCAVRRTSASARDDCTRSGTRSRAVQCTVRTLFLVRPSASWRYCPPRAAPPLASQTPS